jgi:hypothetical protein
MYRYPYYGGLKSELTKRLASSVTQDLAKLQTEEVKELEHGSGHWNLAMFKHLLDLKQDGKNSEDLFAAQVFLAAGDSIVEARRDLPYDT